MRPSRARLEDSKSERERRRQFRGTARVSLDLLDFPLDAYRELSRKNVDRLKGAFRREGCRREFVNNHILVIINQDSLDAALEFSRVTATELRTCPRDDYPELRFRAGVRLTCLHGKHRVQAGREFLSPRDKWWIADFYLDGEYCNMRSYSVNVDD